MFFLSNTLSAQTPKTDLESTTKDPDLIKSTTKEYKIHFGIEGGLGISQLLNKPDFSRNVFGENQLFNDQYGINLNPNAEGRFSVFLEYEAPSGWGIKTYAGYLGKGIPKLQELGSNGTAQRGTDYMHHLITGVMFYTKPVGKVRFGLGIENHSGFLSPRSNTYLENMYKGALGNFTGLKAEVSYQINSRLSLNTYVMGGIHGTVSGKPLASVSGGMTLAYRLCGKKIKKKTDVYRINYEREALKLKDRKMLQQPKIKP